jgi:hypothetical protein
MTKKMQESKIRKIFFEGFKKEITMFCKILIVMLFPVFTIFSHANFNSCDLTDKDVSLTVNEIIREQPDSICSFDGKRMYLMPHRIFPTNNGLFLCNDQSSIFLPALLGDQNGVYLPCVRKLKMRCVNDDCGFCCWDAYKDGIECPNCYVPGEPA